MTDMKVAEKLNAGEGWISRDHYGCAAKGIKQSYEDISALYSRLLKDSALRQPIKNFGRFNRPSKLACCAVALALHDAGVVYPFKEKQDIGIIGTNERGCLNSNLRYFKDYVDTGRKLARGNLFIYTLPSNPMAEAAIHFGLGGPLLYLSAGRDCATVMMRRAEALILQEEARAMLAVKIDETDATCYFLRRKDF